MNKNQKTKEKMCIFFASDYHFEMISLPYIQEKLDENKKIIILTENNLEETIKVLIKKIYLKKEKKDKFLEINWKNDDIEKIEFIKQNLEQEMVIFIKGKEKYISEMNETIKKYVQNKNIELIDCYNIEELGKIPDKIINQYNNILNTSGKKEIQKII